MEKQDGGLKLGAARTDRRQAARRILFHGIAEEVGHGDEAAGFFANFPGVAVGVKRGDHFPELRNGISAQAGDYAVVKQDEGNHGKDVSPEQTGKAEGAYEGRGYKGAEKHENRLKDGDRMAARSFKDSDALAMVNGVLQNADSYGRWKMVERAEDRAEAAELSGDFGGVNGFRPVSDGAVGFRLDALECRRVGVQIGEAHFRESAVGVAKRFVQPGPRAAASCTEVHDAGGVAGLEGIFQPVCDAAVDAAEAHDGL